MAVQPAASPSLLAMAQMGVDGTKGKDAKNGATDKPSITRQIVYNAQLTLVVESFDGIPARVSQLVQEFGGFIANSNLTGSSGSARSGTWTIRIPVPQYAPFLEKASALGKVSRATTSSREVTEEYYDVEARIRNLQRTGERLLTHLEKSTGKLEEILTIEREIGRVRGEIEQLQGRLRVLQDITSLTTVTLVINEIEKYTPPPAVQAVETPTFPMRVASTWKGSVGLLRATGEDIAMILVALAPWMVILVPLAVGIFFVVRGALARHKLRKTGAAQS